MKFVLKAQNTYIHNLRKSQELHVVSRVATTDIPQILPFVMSGHGVAVQSLQKARLTDTEFGHTITSESDDFRRSELSVIKPISLRKLESRPMAATSTF